MHFVVRHNNQDHNFPNMQDAIAFANRMQVDTVHFLNGTKLIRGAFFSWQLVK